MEESQAASADRQAEIAQAFETKEAYASGISWAAVIAGGFVIAASSLILLTLGAGMDLSVMSPAVRMGDVRIGKGAIIWLIIIQIIASALGGYLTGRLRIKWATIHTDEVYFRDTAHGFLAWSVALVITASFLTSSASVIVAGSAPGRTNDGAAPTFGSQTAELNHEPNTYFIDMLFRSTRPGPPRGDIDVRSEATRIFAHALQHRNLPAYDRTYLAGLVAAQTGLGQTEAENRVSSVFADVQEAANANRKAVGHLSLWVFIALLIGAFSASYAATIGGKERDRVQLVRVSRSATY